MSRNPEDVIDEQEPIDELERLRAENAALSEQLETVNRDRERISGFLNEERAARQQLELQAASLTAILNQADHTIGNLRSERQQLSDELASKAARVATLEQVASDFRTILDRHAPAPKTELEELVAEFVAKVSK